MRAFKYPKVDKFPKNAKTVAMYAEENNIAHHYVYVKYERAQLGKTTVNYKIVNYQGINWVVLN